jgi:trans-aconitate methyltransferase
MFLPPLVPCTLAELSSLNDINKGWNTIQLVDKYFNYSEIQIQWGLKTLSQYKFTGDENILDIGCGNGRMSALMSYQVPEGTVTGVDISAPMINYAQNQYPQSEFKNLKFIHTSNQYFNGLTDSPFLHYDVVTALCVFHLVPEPKRLLTNIYDLLVDGGTSLITFPIKANDCFIEVRDKALKQRGWKLPSASNSIRTFSTLDGVKIVLSSLGFEILNLEVAQSRHAFSSKENFINWLEGTLTANWAIPESASREFFQELATEYFRLQPHNLKDNGFFYFDQTRMVIHAKKPLAK